MKLTELFNQKNIFIAIGLFINLNIYAQDMLLINNQISYGLLLLQMILNIVLLYVTSFIKNNNIEIFIWLLFSLCIIISDYLNNYRICINPNNNGNGGNGDGENGNGGNGDSGNGDGGNGDGGNNNGMLNINWSNHLFYKESNKDNNDQLGTLVNEEYANINNN